MVASTIDDNIATFGGGVYNGNGSGANIGTVTIVDSTVYSNMANGSGYAGRGGAIYNMGALAVTASTIYSNTAASSINIPASGGGIYRNGGTAALTDTIDAVAAASCIPPTDQRGYARPDESADAGICDVGAVESGATATATPTVTGASMSVPPTSASTSIVPPANTATATAPPSPTTPCSPFYAGVAAGRVARGGTEDILFAAPSGSTIAAAIDAGALYFRDAALLLPTQCGGIGARILTGTHAGASYRYTFPVGAFFRYGYALLSFGIPRNAPSGTAPVTAAAREPGGCTATATTRFTVVAEQAVRGGLARSAAAWAGRGVTGTLLGAMRADAPRAALSRSGLTLYDTTPVGARRSGGTAAGGGSAVSTRGASLAACRDIVVSSLPLRLTTASRIRVSGTAGYLPAGPRASQTTLYVALRDASRPRVLAAMWVTVGARLDHVALLGGDGVLRGLGRRAGRDYVAAPGRYLLQLHLTPRGRGAQGTLALRVVALV